MREDLVKLKELYDNGVNIIDWLKKNSDSQKLIDFTAISYDLQAGSYITKVEKYPEYHEERTNEYSKIINSLNKYQSILEVGIGEGTTFARLLP